MILQGAAISKATIGHSLVSAFLRHRRTDDALDKPATAYVCLESRQYQIELDPADKYRLFISELLRLSLAGIAVFPFILKLPGSAAHYPWTAITGVCFLAPSATCAVLFLFLASEALRWYIAGRRLYQPTPGSQTVDTMHTTEATEMLQRRLNISRLCHGTMALSALFLLAGAPLIAGSVIDRLH